MTERAPVGCTNVHNNAGDLAKFLMKSSGIHQRRDALKVLP